MDDKPKRAPSRLPRPRKRPPEVTTDIPTPGEQWYLDCLRLWCQEMGRAPMIMELASWISRTAMPTWTALARLEAKGLVTRTAQRRFIPAEFAGVLR